MSKKIQVDHAKNRVITPLEGSPRIVLLSGGQAGILDLPSYCEVKIKVHDGKVVFTDVTEKHSFQSLVAD